MTFRIISNTCGSVQQPLQLESSSNVQCNRSAQSVQLQQHQLSAGAGHHQCTRFCCFEPLFGNVFKCQTSGLTHICDQGCSERIFLDNHFDICRFSKKLFPTHTHSEAISRKRSIDDGSHTGLSSKRVHSMNSCSSCPLSINAENMDCNWA